MSVRPVGPGFSPLDEALGLSGSRYSPRVLAWLVRLGAELPFARAAVWLADLTGVALSAATIRRQTEAVGATLVAQAEAECTRLQQERPAPPVRPQRLVVGVDGAMVPLRGGEWAEVKLLSIGVPTLTPAAATCTCSSIAPRGEVRAGEARAGEVRAGEVRAGEALTRTGEVSYFARLADAETFGTQALGEVHRRGVEAATAVAAVQDGAPWLQGFVDLHRPDALRILDWPHAAEHLKALAEALFGRATLRAQRAAERLRRWLWEHGPARVLAVLAGWQRARPNLAPAVAYFRERQAQLAYPAFRAAGWPVGSGATESGHKQVMQARMKRAGMRWAREHVNPLLALRLLDHNGRWSSEGPALFAEHRRACHHHQAQRRDARHRLRHPPVPVAAHPVAPPPPPAAVPDPVPRRVPTPSRTHPWRRYYSASLSPKI